MSERSKYKDRFVFFPPTHAFLELVFSEVLSNDVRLSFHLKTASDCSENQGKFTTWVPL